MCFSAKASFAAAGALSIIGIVSIKQTRTKKLLPFAMTPFLFALQQASEGFVWITLNRGDTTSLLHWTSVYIFLFFAGMFWPTWASFSLYVTEDVKRKKHLLFNVLCLGIITSLLLLYCWILQVNQATIVNHHIDYPIAQYPFGITNQTMGNLISYLLSFLYASVTIIPLFISSLPYSKALGIIIIISALIAYLSYFIAFASTWCFFVALSSMIICFIVYTYERHNKNYYAS